MSDGQNRPRVGIIMGSVSDMGTMTGARDTLAELRIPFELRVLSAHRTPDEMFVYAQSAAQRGIRVIIAGAGGAAHLPGMTAAKTTLPVIGVPVLSEALRGIDSLLSIAQMPVGVPVAAMAIGNATNAALFAARILALEDSGLQTRLAEYARAMSDAVLSIKL
ncbi:MAG: 5-(carboxyamino)imidazole ribonucleotide mutase [Candidatus Eremiobacteraeota bacterium]|nr:5-(carboxyamino)imidazole ribonucleotide mutase [Candidatus Eremiobacteraeota bacterium]